MDRLLEILGYYLNNEEDVKENNNDQEERKRTNDSEEEIAPHSQDKRNTTHTYHHSYHHYNNAYSTWQPWALWNPFGPANHTVNNYYNIDKKEDQKDKIKADDEEKAKPNYTASTIWFAIATSIIYNCGNSWRKFCRTSNDWREIQDVMCNINLTRQIGYLKVTQLIKLLKSFYYNRLWSIINQFGLFLGTTCLGISYINPSCASVFFPIGFGINVICVFSGALRCSMWRNDSIYRQQKVKGIYHNIQVLRPPAYNPEAE